MITIPPSLLAHPVDLQRLAGELLALRFDRARLTEALLAMQEQAGAAEQRPPSEAERLAGKTWGVDITWCQERKARHLAHKRGEGPD